MKLQHKDLIDLLKKAYSGEKAAALAYSGHAASLKDQTEKAEIKQIEIDEWNHRHEIFQIMEKYEIEASKYYEFRSYIIGQIICLSCYFIGRFMPFYFAGKLESQNVGEYLKMKEYFNQLDIQEHNNLLLNLSQKEKDHENYLLERIKNHKFLPIFEKIFNWGSISAVSEL
jgi:rubrerythrin